MNDERSLHVPSEFFAEVRRSAMRQVIVIAENRVAGLAIVDLLAEVGHQGFLAEDAQEAARLVALNPAVDVAIVQATAPSLDLWWLLDGLIQLRPEMKIVSTFDDPEAVCRGVELPIDLELTRDWDMGELFQRLSGHELSMPAMLSPLMC
jgi:DNA-binding response OmpR family regulator